MDINKEKEDNINKNKLIIFEIDEAYDLNVNSLFDLSN